MCGLVLPAALSFTSIRQAATLIPRHWPRSTARPLVSPFRSASHSIPKTRSMLRIMSVQVLVYPALGSNSGLLDEAPIATISGSNTGLMEPYGIALDSAGKIYVTDNLTAMVAVFVGLGNRAGPLTEPPPAVIGESKPGLSEPQGIRSIPIATS